MRSKRWPRCLLLLACLTASLSVLSEPHATAQTAEAKAIAFLIREVPAWPRENGCFSCHNNGDAARALFLAARRGYHIPAEALAATTAWLSAPAGWDENKGDPGFSDKRLADVQFAAALLTGLETGQLTEPRALQTAAQRLVKQQDANGAWPMDVGNAAGSPATYGTALATWQALRVLQAVRPPVEFATATQRALRWLRQQRPQNVPLAATLLLAFPQDAGLRTQCVNFLRQAQTRDGGWGPYASAPPEAFDTALALLALAQVRQHTSVEPLIQRGRQFLTATQNPDGSWPATTRPPGGTSYAQQMSTTGWATQALLVSGDR
jgi:prenyltransferase beta subunit